MLSVGISRATVVKIFLPSNSMVLVAGSLDPFYSLPCGSCATQFVYIWTSHLLLAHPQDFRFSWTFSLPSSAPGIQYFFLLHPELVSLVFLVLFSYTWQLFSVPVIHEGLNSSFVQFKSRISCPYLCSKTPPPLSPPQGTSCLPS